MMINITSEPLETMKLLTRAFPGILALALAATLLAGCGKQEPADAQGKSAQIESKAEPAKGLEELEAGYAAMDAGIYAKYGQIQQKTVTDAPKNDNEQIAAAIAGSAYAESQYKTAVEHFRKSADEGNTDAMLMLYLCSRRGIGVKRQEVSAIADQYLIPAAEAGNEIAKAFYGRHLILAEREKEKGLEMIRKVADSGCVFAQYMLVVIAQKTLDKEDVAGVMEQYLEKLASLPMTDRKTVLDHVPGFIYNEEYFDVGGPEIIEMKVPTIENKIVVCSQILLGTYLFQGKNGFPRDREKAKKWIRAAGENGFTKADAVLKNM